MEATNDYKTMFTEDEKETLKGSCQSFYDLVGCPEGPIINKKLFFSVFMALIISIPNYTIFGIYDKIIKKEEKPEKNIKNEPKKLKNNNKKIKYDNNNFIDISDISGEEDEKSENNNENNNEESEEAANDEEIEKKLDSLYVKYIDIPQKDFKSKLLLKRVNNKYEYYTKTYEYRELIQNYNYNYRNLDNDAVQYMQAREYTKAQKEQINKYGIGPIKCTGCNTKWLQKEFGECIYCDKKDSIDFYLVVANFFQIIGDADTFWDVIKKEYPNIYDLITDHGKEIQYFFKNERKKVYSKVYYNIVKEYGKKQFNQLVRKKGREVIDEEDNKPYKEFNRKYNLALIKKQEIIDLREATNAFKEDFIYDLSLIHFPFVTRLYMAPRKIDINDFKPDMPNLAELNLENCKIKYIELDPEFFQKLWRINLQYNLIEDKTNIRGLKRLPALKIIELHENPIEKTNEIYSTKEDFKKSGILIKFSYQKMFNFYHDIEEEEDSEIKETMKKFEDCHDEQSLPSESSEDNNNKDNK